MNEMFQEFNLPVIPVNWNNGYWLSADLWDTFDYIKILIGDVPCIVAKPLREIPPISTLLGQFSDVRLEENIPIILQVNRLSEKRRNELLGANIPFVSPGQIYLPFMGIELQKRLRKKRPVQNLLTPLSQQMLFFFFYHWDGLYRAELLSEIFNTDKASVAYALRQLKYFSFVDVDEYGNSVSISQSMSRRALYVLAKPHLINPVRLVKHVADDKQVPFLPLAGETALSEYSMLAPPHVKSVSYYGAEEDFPSTSEHSYINNQVRVEFWSYSPTILSEKKGVADVLSVVSSLYDFADIEDDPRLDKALGEAIDEALGME